MGVGCLWAARQGSLSTARGCQAGLSERRLGRHRQFFLSGKTLPIERGRGLQQPAMQTAARLLGRGDWVHVFPEGRVGYSGRLQQCKWGVGKLVCDCLAESGK